MRSSSEFAFGIYFFVYHKGQKIGVANPAKTGMTAAEIATANKEHAAKFKDICEAFQAGDTSKCDSEQTCLNGISSKDLLFEKLAQAKKADDSSINFCVTNNVLALPQGADLKNICTQVATDFVSKDSGVCDSDLAKGLPADEKAMCKALISRNSAECDAIKTDSQKSYCKDRTDMLNAVEGGAKDKCLSLAGDKHDSKWQVMCNLAFDCSNVGNQ